MYLRTPKRYRQGQRRSIISLRWLWLWLLTPLIVAAGVYLYNNREGITPQVREVIAGIVDSAQDAMATVTAPTPLPTADPSQRQAQADAAWVRGNIEDAVSLYEEISPALPNDVNLHYRIALGLIMDGRLREALAAAENAVTADPYSPDAWAIRAMALNWNERNGEAIASALHAISLAGQDNPRARARAEAFLAEAYLDAGQYDRALSTVERALETDPNSFEAYRVRARHKQEVQFLFDAALADYQTAYDLAPNLSYLAVDLALIHINLGDSDTGLGILRDLIELNPRNTRALFWLGALYLNTVGSPEQASDYLTRCVELDPESINCHYTLGRAQHRLQNYASAYESFRTAVDLGTTNPRHYWWAGRAQVLLGNCPAAVPYFRTGYGMAREGGDEALIADFEDQMRSCQMFADLPPEPDAEATEEPLRDES